MPVLEKPQIGTEEKEQMVHHEAIFELQGPLEKILEQIGSQNFDLIIGDDASGRIPTLILSKFFKAKAEEGGRKTPQIIFIAGGTRNIEKEEKRKNIVEDKKAKLTQLLKNTKKSIGNTDARQRVLIITDSISSGNTLQPLIEALKEQDFNIHVATVAIYPPWIKEEFIKRFDVNITYGIIDATSIWSKHKLAGVIRKEDQSEIHSQSYKKSKPFSEEKAAEIQKTINLSREDANIIADRLIEKFLV